MNPVWSVYNYCDHRKTNLIEDWLNNGLQVPERARMIRKLDALRKNGPDLSSELLSDTPSPQVKKFDSMEGWLRGFFCVAGRLIWRRSSRCCLDARNGIGNSFQPTPLQQQRKSSICHRRSNKSENATCL